MIRIWTKYNNIYCVYREILLRVWEVKKNVKVNPVLDEIASFSQLNNLMAGFEFNLINNIFVPTNDELDNEIDITDYQSQINNLIIDRRIRKVEDENKDSDPKEIRLSYAMSDV